MLHVPKISKNFISVSKLTSDNNVVVEFDACGCNVKDKRTGKVMFKECKRRDCKLN